MAQSVSLDCFTQKLEVVDCVLKCLPFYNSTLVYGIFNVTTPEFILCSLDNMSNVCVLV